MKGRCRVCGGHGYLMDPRENVHFRRKGRIPCPNCRGEVKGPIRPWVPEYARDQEPEARDD